MNLRKRFSMAVQALVAGGMIAALVAACGGGGGGFSQTYTASAGVGEVLLLTVNTAQLTYTYQVSYTSYAASGVVAGQSSTGALTAAFPAGSYTMGKSNDGFILGGKILPVQNGLLAGNVQLAPVGGTNRIPVFGVSNPITLIASASGVYNYQGFGCSAPGIPNASGNAGCFSQAGTINVASSGAVTVCRGGDINTSPAYNPCVSSSAGTLNALAASGVFDFRNAANAHIGWFFAFNAPNGKKIAVIDHDDAVSIPPMFGHSILTTYASAVSGASDGSYLVMDNEGVEQQVTVAGAALTATAASSLTGTMTLNSPWPGLNAYRLGAPVTASGVARTADGGVYTYTSKVDSAVFGVGVRYSP